MATKYLSTKEAAERLGYKDASAIRGLHRDGKLPRTLRFGDNVNAPLMVHPGDLAKIKRPVPRKPGGGRKKKSEENSQQPLDN